MSGGAARNRVSPGIAVAFTLTPTLSLRERGSWAALFKSSVGLIPVVAVFELAPEHLRTPGAFETQRERRPFSFSQGRGPGWGRAYQLISAQLH